MDTGRYLDEVRHHLREELLPFWQSHGTDEEYGGFLTYFDRDGNPTGETMKSLLCQTRMIYAFSLAHRYGHGGAAFLNRAARGLRFVMDHYYDRVHGGWYWTAQQNGVPIVKDKVVYGHSFVIYAFSEFAQAADDRDALRAAETTFDILQTHASDTVSGGYYEFFEEHWESQPPGAGGGDTKSLDVHMHLMEAFTNLYAASGHISHRLKAEQVMELIQKRMLEPESGTGIAQFGPDFTPRRAITFNTVWGSDRDAEEPEGRPLDNTSYGHNVELGWLMHRTGELLGLDRNSYLPVIKKLYDHCLEYGIDWERGGVYCEGPHQGPARERNKEFWQQAEAMVAMLDAYETFGDARYWEAYTNVHHFVMNHVINHEVGEWRALLGPDNQVIWDYLGHAWKINYHTVRAMIECEERLTRLQDRAGGKV